MKDFRSLTVWQKAHQCALGVYRVTSPFPASERFNVTSQLRRSAVSVPSNIAEGCGRRTDADVARFMQIAMGSASEMEDQLLLARDLGTLAAAHHAELAAEVVQTKKMLSSLLKRLRTSR